MKIMTINAIFSTSNTEAIKNPTRVESPIKSINNLTSQVIKSNLEVKDATNEIKRFRKRKEHVRNGAMLPDTIKLGSYITSSRIPSKVFRNRCRNLLKPCNRKKECKPHISFNNLRNLSKNLNMIWLDPERFSKDWENEKSIDTGKNG